MWRLVEEIRLTNAPYSVNVANPEVGSLCVELTDVSIAGTQGLRRTSSILYFLASNRLGRTVGTSDELESVLSG
jgi:hypothetical protein